MWNKADEFMLEAAICMHRSSLQTCIFCSRELWTCVRLNSSLASGAKQVLICKKNKTKQNETERKHALTEEGLHDTERIRASS